VIDIATDNPVLLDADRKAIDDLVTEANERLENENVAPLYLTIESHRSELMGDLRAQERESFAAHIEQARAEGDEALAAGLEAVRDSRAVRANLVDEYVFQLEELLT